MPPLRRAAALLLVLPCLHSCARTLVDIERERAKSLSPAGFESRYPPLDEPRPAPRTYRVRVYADQAYRSQALRWEERIRQQLARAGEVTARPFGVTFELVDARPWDSSPPPSEPLSALLLALEKLDPAAGVDLVLGYTSSLPVVTAALDQLGYARALGRHAVLRGMESVEEDRALKQALGHLPDAERERVYLQRKAHKETAVLLHEWGHTLGAPHSGEDLMHDNYDHRMRGFAEDSAAVMRIGLRQKAPGLDDPEARSAWAREVDAWLGSPAGKALDDGARKYLADLVEAARAGEGVAMSRADQEAMLRAAQQDRAGQYAEAGAALRPLLERYPKHARLHALACQVVIHADTRDDASWALCKKAAELDPRSPSSALFVADLAHRRKDPAVKEALARARAVLEQMKEAPEDHWSYLAAIHRGRLEVTAAEETAARAGDDVGAADVRSWAVRTRRWVGLVPGAVPADLESDYVREFLAAQQDLEQGDLKQASLRVEALEKDFAGAVGALTLRCELQIRQGAGVRGMKECRRALERYAESVHAQYLLGVALSGGRSWKDAAVSLERVVELDPTISDAWVRLSEAYHATGNTRSVDQLKERYRQQFGRPAPFR